MGRFKFIKVIQLPYKSKIMQILFLSILGTIGYYWGNVLCDKFPHILLYVVIMILGFKYAIEFGNSYSDNPILLDFRSTTEKIEDMELENEELIHNSKKHLMLKLAEGQVSEEEATLRLNSIINLVEENNIKLLK